MVRSLADVSCDKIVSSHCCKGVQPFADHLGLARSQFSPVHGHTIRSDDFAVDAHRRCAIDGFQAGKQRSCWSRHPAKTK